MNTGGPLSFAQAVMEAQQQIQDALRAGMGAQPQQPQEQQQQPMMPMGPQLDPMQAMMQQQMMQQQMMQQMMPQQMPPQPMMQPQQMMPQQMMQPQQFARGGAVWQRKEGKNPEGGLNAAGRASLKAQGHDIKPPVSAKQAKKSPKAAARRK